MLRELREIQGIIYEIRTSVHTGELYAEIIGRNERNMPTHVIIPDIIEGGIPVVEITCRAFQDCQKLQVLELPAGFITNIGYEAFVNCSELQTITAYSIPHHYQFKPSKKVQVHIATGAFYKCKNLTFVDVGANIVELGAECFAECTQLKKIANHIQVVDIRTFYGCENLNNLLFYGNVRAYTDTFAKCKMLKDITFLGTIDSNHTVKQCMQKFKRCRIQCTPSFNYLEWAYEGTDITFI